MDVEETIKTLKGVKNARKDLKTALDICKKSRILCVVLMIITCCVVPYLLTKASILCHIFGGLGIAFFIMMMLGLINLRKEIKKTQTYIENAEFLESYWKGALWENGYDWRKV